MHCPQPTAEAESPMPACAEPTSSAGWTPPGLEPEGACSCAGGTPEWTPCGSNGADAGSEPYEPPGGSLRGGAGPPLARGEGAQRAAGDPMATVQTAPGAPPIARGEGGLRTNGPCRHCGLVRCDCSSVFEFRDSAIPRFSPNFERAPGVLAGLGAFPPEPGGSDLEVRPGSTRGTSRGRLDRMALLTRSRPVEATILNLRDLSGVSVVNVGKVQYAYDGSELIVSLPEDAARSSVDAMMTDFLPEFWSARNLSWGEANANIRYVADTLKFNGLFWDSGWGTMHRACLWALVLLEQCADLVFDPTGTSGYSAANLRSTLMAGGLPLYLSAANPKPFGPAPGWQFWPAVRVDGRGRFQVRTPNYRSSPPYGITFAGTITLYSPTMLYAAAADYYFWQAQRLHAQWQSTGDYESMIAGWLCAKAGLSEIAAFSTVIVHEYTHWYRGRPYECSHGTTADQCVTFLHSFFYVQRVFDRFSLPNPSDANFDASFYRWSPRTDADSIAYDRFDKASDDESTLTPYYGVDRCDNGRDTDGVYIPIAEGSRSSFWRQGSVSVSWEMPSECTGGAPSSGITIFTNRPS